MSEGIVHQLTQMEKSTNVENYNEHQDADNVNNNGMNPDPSKDNNCNGVLLDQQLPLCSRSMSKVRLRDILTYDEIGDDVTSTDKSLCMDDDSTEDNANVTHSDNTFEEPNLKSLLDLWDLSELYSKFTEHGYTYRALQYIEEDDFKDIIGDDIHLNGPMRIFRSLHRKWKTDSGSTSSRNEIPNTIDLKSIIDRSEKGKEIYNSYRNNKILSYAMKKQLVKIILDYTFEKNSKLTRNDMRAIACQIYEIFPNERQDVYYEQIGKEQPTGLLYQDYHNALRTIRKRKLETAEKPLSPEDELFKHLTDDVEASISYLKNDELKNGRLTLQHWKASFEYRRARISICENVDEVVEEWPHLRISDAYILINVDFTMKHGIESAQKLTSDWDQFVSKNTELIIDMIKNKDPVTANALRQANSSSNLNSINKAMALALHQLIIPSSKVVKGKRWTPTIRDSKDSFLVVVRRVSDMSVKLEVRKKFCCGKQMKLHPMIFEIETGNKFVVAMNDIQYESETIVEAMDVAFKMFDMFKLPFPHESKNFWSFINEIFFKIHNNNEEKLCNKIKIILQQIK